MCLKKEKEQEENENVDLYEITYTLWEKKKKIRITEADGVPDSKPIQIGKNNVNVNIKPKIKEYFDEDSDEW